MNARITNAARLFRLVTAIFLAAAGTAQAGAPTLGLQLFASPIDRPVAITHAGDGSGRVFIVEQTGSIRIVDAGGTLLETPFLDLDAQSACCGEQGVLGLAFHPDYAINGTFYVHYSDNSGDTVVSRFEVTADPNIADTASELELLTVAQPFSNHNGGQIAFGPDGYLYISLGDGGSAGDPGDRAQNLGLLLGKMLRIDVDNPQAPNNYGIPGDNPFVGVAGASEEIWAYGLRNAWRFSFDRSTGDIFIADVGQNTWEEINLQPASSTGGENWGWRCYEGNAEYNTNGCGAAGEYDFPILVYQHSGGNCSINGGYRYRGPNYPNLRGTYLFGDYCTGKIWGAVDGGGTWTAGELYDLGSSFATFGEDQYGELLVATYSSSGSVYRIVDTSTTPEVFADGFENGETTSWDLVAP